MELLAQGSAAENQQLAIGRCCPPLYPVRVNGIWTNKQAAEHDAQRTKKAE
jgi:hypothetical protein